MIQDIFPPVKLKPATLKQHIEGYLKSIAHKRAETIGTYERSLQEFIYFFVTDRRFEFRVKDVERYRKHLAQTKNMKNASIATYMTSLRRLCQYLVEIEVLEKNPAKRVQGGSRPTEHNRTFLTLEEVDTLLGNIEQDSETGLRDTAIIRTMLGCACSELELMNLDIGDIQQVGKQWYILVQGKGKSIKDERVPVPLQTVLALEKYLEYRRKPNNPPLPPDSPVFLSYSNRSMRQRATVRGIREAIMVRLKASGVRQDRIGKLTPFSLRHTAGILMVESGASVEELMSRMRIEWRPTAMLYFKQKGKLRSDGVKGARELVALA
jgi:site-specific recombinase XerD